MVKVGVPELDLVSKDRPRITADRWLLMHRITRRGRAAEPAGITRSLRNNGGPDPLPRIGTDRLCGRGLAHSSPNANIIARFFGDVEAFVGDVCGS
jgi:hypothetical protein